MCLQALPCICVYMHFPLLLLALNPWDRICHWTWAGCFLVRVVTNKPQWFSYLCLPAGAIGPLGHIQSFIYVLGIWTQILTLTTMQLHQPILKVFFFFFALFNVEKEATRVQMELFLRLWMGTWLPLWLFTSWAGPHLRALGWASSLSAAKERENGTLRRKPEPREPGMVPSTAQEPCLRERFSSGLVVYHSILVISAVVRCQA